MTMVFRGNGNTALPFQVHGVHQPLGHLLIVAEHAALPEKLIHHRGFTVVNMSDDCHIPDLPPIHNTPE